MYSSSSGSNTLTVILGRRRLATAEAPGVPPDKECCLLERVFEFNYKIIIKV
jgi:hypothetical protein